jgi:hypothetical protein
MSGRKPTAFIVRFFEKVEKEENCWQWTANKNNKGYGMIYWEKHMKKMLAHRAMWEMTNGEIPAGLHVLHRCDNPSCVNPDHLFLGTHRENMQDKLAKGRAYPEGWRENVQEAAAKRRHPDGTWEDRQKVFRANFVGPHPLNTGRFSDKGKGAGNTKAKLQDYQVLEIRRLHSTGDHSYAKLSAQFGITKGMVGHIVRRMCWSHI